jgi:diguanylate cyclase (GGDEF)-like protein/PAS domain S-box-containing protein
MTRETGDTSELPDDQGDKALPQGLLRGLYDVAVAAGGASDQQAVAQVAVATVKSLLRADAVVLRLREAGGELRVVAVAGEVGGGGGEPALSVPLLIEGRTIGSLDVLSADPVPLAAAGGEQLLALFAAQVAPALDAVRLAGRREAQVRKFQALHDLAVAASGVLHMGALARLTVGHARAMLGVDGAVLCVWNRDSELVELVAHDGITRADARAGYAPGEGTIGVAYQERRPVVVDDYQGWSNAVSPYLDLGIGSAVAVPLIAHDLAIGALSVWTMEPRHFDDDDVQLLTLLAAQLAPSLEAARLYAESDRQRAEAEALAQLMRQGAAEPTVERAIALIAQRASLLLGADYCAIALFREGELGWEGIWGNRTDRWRRGRPSPGGAVQAAIRGGETLIFERLAEHPGFPVAFPMAAAEGACSVAATPMYASHSTVGALLLGWRSENGIRSLQRELMEAIASFAATIVEEARGRTALRESEGRFRAVFDRAAVGIARIDLKGRIIEANAALHSMLSFGPTELHGLDFVQIVHPGDIDPMELMALSEGRRDQAQMELRYRCKDARAVWVNSIVSLVRGPDGEPQFVIAMVEDITDRKAQEAALEHQALHDALTDLPNRTLLHDRLQQALLASHRDGEPVALMVMDLDRFKEVNDSLGHHFGDQLLQQVALRLRHELRDSDTVARLGGDEFAMVLPGVGDEAAGANAARKILAALEEPFEVDVERIHVGASIGISLFPLHGEDPDTLLRRADIAMYVAKRAGSGYALYTLEDDKSSRSRLALIGELRHAIERDELVLHYQPKLELATSRIVGVEALVRWQHPQLGLIPPDDFIPLAEDTGLIRPLGMWVLRAAIRQSRDWSAGGLDLQVAVNLSARNLHDPALPDLVDELLVKHAVRRDRLRIEITESTLMADPERAMEILTRLAGMGVRLAIDDFGTGYSSLAYLRRLPVDEIKIDKSFVLEMTSAENAAVIVRSTIDLGHNLGLSVVAEGVETQEAWTMLAASSCDQVQGFGLSAPIRPDEVAPWVAAFDKRVRVRRAAAGVTW